MGIHIKLFFLFLSENNYRNVQWNIFQGIIKGD